MPTETDEDADRKQSRTALWLFLWGPILLIIVLGIANNLSGPGEPCEKIPYGSISNTDWLLLGNEGWFTKVSDGHSVLYSPGCAD